MAAVSFPFLQLEASGLTSAASVIDTIRSYSVASGIMAPLSALMAALIVVLPALRLGGLIYALSPLAAGRAPARFATPAFRISMAMRPWAMAEIFIIGVAVALIKIAALATVSFGPSFWAFTALVVLTTAKDSLVCERTLWRILARS
ncbi:MAG: paraquat-inducible protein A, partial [Afipia sp.]